MFLAAHIQAWGTDRIRERSSRGVYALFGVTKNGRVLKLLIVSNLCGQEVLIRPDDRLWAQFVRMENVHSVPFIGSRLALPFSVPLQYNIWCVDSILCLEINRFKGNLAHGNPFFWKRGNFWIDIWINSLTTLRTWKLWKLARNHPE